MKLPEGPILFDTNVVVLLVRGGNAGQRIDSELQLRARSERALICVVTVGEALSLTKRNGWGADKRERLESVLRELVVVDINNPLVLESYADLEVFAQARGRSLGDNDTWIAATASVTGATLLTTDRDFDPLHPEMIARVLINVKSGAVIDPIS